ncbi:hypothetical protein [Nonomuraea sp. NPDC050310]|uniref:lipopolysaccharide biosynthesis protein n=1 Tax=unclassified Nonomuraea TaxID=2593643 RepID=UPI0033D4E6AE
MSRLRTELRNPLFLQGYALMANTAITAVLGLGYWMLATRLYSPDAFGEGQAMISAMRLFASLTGLAFAGMLARFIPVAGRRTGELVGRAYAVAGAIGVLAALVFLLTLPMWGTAYASLAGLLPGLLFLLAVLVWTVFTLQDVVLTGLRRAVWVPAGSLAFGLVKMALLGVLAVALPSGGVLGGIFVSWIIPTALALIPVNWYIFRVLAPRAADPAAQPAVPLSARRIGRFLAGDFPGALSALLVIFLVPVLVAGWVEDVAHFGYFTVAHSLGCMVALLANNLALSLTVESSLDAGSLARNLRATLRRAFLVLGPIVGLTVLAAPLLLGVFGGELAEYGTPLLRLMALAVIPGMLIEVHLATLRARSAARRLAVTQIGLALLVLGSVTVAFPLWGITGVGLALLGSQVVVAALVLPHILKDCCE